MAADAESKLISLHDAAQRLGVHYMTVYRYVRTGRLPAVKVGAEWRVDPADLDRLGGDGQPAPVTPIPGTRRRRLDHHRRLEDRLLAGDESGAWSVLEAAMTSGLEPDEIYVEVLGPAMRSIGDKWAAGTVSVGEEHRASVVMLRLIGRLGPRFLRRGRKRGSVVIGAPSGDHHGVPVALAADLLRGEGYAVVDLGADTPTQSFVDAALEAERLIGVGLSATTVGNEDAVAATVAAVKRDVGCPVVLGGSAIPDQAAGLALGADVVTETAADLIAAFDGFSPNRARSHA